MAGANLTHELPSVSNTMPRMRSPEVWVNEIPKRWAATGATAGFVISFAIFFSPLRPMGLAQVVPTTLAITALAGLSWLLLGFWARWSLRSHLHISAHAALLAIRGNWLSGSAILAGTPIILRRAAIEFGLYPHVPPTELDDFIAAITAFPVMMFGAYLLSIVSGRALATRIQHSAYP